MSLNPYQKAAELAKNGDSEGGWKIIGKLLLDDPNDPQALVTGSYLMNNMGGLPQAYHFAKSATQILPNDSAAWTNLGHAASRLWLVAEAERSYAKALECSKGMHDTVPLWVNLGALYLDNGLFDKALEYTQKVLEVDPTHKNAVANLGFCQLATRDWANGWKGYHNTIGSDWRPKVQYADEPEWDGTKGKNVVLYADQGLGDEISFASMVPDAIKACRKVVIDCDDRLEGLFRRSFPQAKVYGTRKAKDGKWAKEDWQIDASLPLGQIGEFFRTSADDFLGTPYLVPCPARVAMWEGLWAKKGKPVIGIAWTGGSPKTNARNRRIALEDFLPVFRKVDAHFVSLQYKDASDEIAAFKAKHKWVDLEQYKWGTLTNDYDDTAALIASLDYVLCIQTAVAHTAGALGVPVSVMVPVATQWRYGSGHDSIPWYECLRVIRQQKHGSWSGEIERVSRELKSYFQRVPRRTAADARAAPGLRDGGRHLRGNGLARREPDGSDASAGLRMRSEH